MDLVRLESCIDLAEQQYLFENTARAGAFHLPTAGKDDIEGPHFMREQRDYDSWNRATLCHPKETSNTSVK